MLSKNVKARYKKILDANQRCQKINASDIFYTLPSRQRYPYQWFWDSCFHSIIYSSLHLYQHAKEEILSLLSAQWKNGMIPHVIYWHNKRHKVNWGTSSLQQQNAYAQTSTQAIHTSSLTQPPMIAYAVERLYSNTRDKDSLNLIYHKLDAYYKWLDHESGNNNLISIIHPWESGEDDFVHWDDVLKLKNPSRKELHNLKLKVLKKFVQLKLNRKKFLSTNKFNVKSVLFNAIYLRNLKSMLLLSKALKSKNKQYYESKISKVKKAFKDVLYDDDSGLFLTRYNLPGQTLNNKQNHKISDHETSSIFMPLFSEVITKNRARKLVNNYLFNENKFFTAYPVPTVSLQNKKFKANRYWRGSVWININWFIYKGLINYKLNSDAEELKNHTFKLINKSKFHEYYNPINGKGYGPDDFTWSGLVFDM